MFEKKLQEMKSKIKKLLLTTPTGCVLMTVPRLLAAIKGSGAIGKILFAFKWAANHRDIGPRSYELSDLNRFELCATISMITGTPLDRLFSLIEEIYSDHRLSEYLSSQVNASSEKWSHDANLFPGRRLAYYILVRVLRPRLVVEAGVDRGHGAVLIARALEKNAEDGHAGEYVGIEHTRDRDFFLLNGLPEIKNKIVFGDSVDIIRNLSGPVDLFFHETTSNPKHVREQLKVIKDVVSDHAVIAAPWLTEEMIAFAKAGSWRFLTFKDEPLNHWYHGSRMTFIFK